MRPCREELVAGLKDFGPGGGGFAAYVGGQPVVDLWGGMAAPGQPWERQNLAVVMSTTKGLVTMCAQILVDRGLLDPEERVAHYWPEFAQARQGHHSCLPRHLTHTLEACSDSMSSVRPLRWDGQVVGRL